MCESMVCFKERSIKKHLHFTVKGSKMIDLVWRVYSIGFTLTMLMPSSALPYPLSLNPSTTSSLIEGKSTTLYCDSQKTFTNEQKQFCYNNIELVKVFIDGFKLGVAECQATFKDSVNTGTRWNCTNLANKKKDNVFFGVAQAKANSKEASVMTAFTAAGMLYNLLKQCSSGKLTKCKLSELFDCQSGSVSSRKCREINFEVPQRLLETFFLVSLGPYPVQIAKQNRDIGFKAIKQLIYTDVTTQKQTIRPLKELNDYFLKLYKNQSFRLKKKDLIDGKIPPLKLSSLRSKLLFVYREDRFNYCKKNENWNWVGIGRRPCKFQTRDSYSIENCINMCCDFGYIKIPELRNVCEDYTSSTTAKKCQVKTVDSYYCKHQYETVKKTNYRREDLLQLEWS